MTDADKLADYQRVVEIVRAQLSLEQHCVDRQRSPDDIRLTQVDAYREIVMLVTEGAE
jgi:hypothetical protein